MRGAVLLRLDDLLHGAGVDVVQVDAVVIASCHQEILRTMECQRIEAALIVLCEAGKARLQKHTH